MNAMRTCKASTLASCSCCMGLILVPEGNLGNGLGAELPPDLGEVDDAACAEAALTMAPPSRGLVELSAGWAPWWRPFSFRPFSAEAKRISIGLPCSI